MFTTSARPLATSSRLRLQLDAAAPGRRGHRGHRGRRGHGGSIERNRRHGARQRHGAGGPVADATTAGAGGGTVRRRRRTVVAVLLATFVACGIVLTHDVLADPSGVPASAASGRPALPATSVTARPGDTLWSIAERYRGEVSIGRYVDLLVRVNGGASIEAGQAVVLP